MGAAGRHKCWCTHALQCEQHQRGARAATGHAAHHNPQICDEAHRLKAKGGNKTIDALLALRCARRVLLTGTPVQNRLDEFFALMSFATPSLLGAFATFQRVYGEACCNHNSTTTRAQLAAALARQHNVRCAGCSPEASPSGPPCLRRPPHAAAR
jgi:hypothetical protein